MIIISNIINLYRGGHGAISKGPKFNDRNDRNERRGGNPPSRRGGPSKNLARGGRPDRGGKPLRGNLRRGGSRGGSKPLLERLPKDKEKAQEILDNELLKF